MMRRIETDEVDPVVGEPAEKVEVTWWFPRVWGSMLLVLVAVTHPLWFATGASVEFPRVPLVSALPDAAVFGRGLSIVLVASLLLVIAAPRRLRFAWWFVSASLCASFLFDQHRLQPWAFQSAIYGLVFAAMDPAAARRWLIPVAASVYVYSALGKFDFQFAHTVGQDFLHAVTRPLGGLPDSVDFVSRIKLALLFPACELIAGIGLLPRRTRMVAGVVVMLMHAALVGLFSRFALDHSTGVVVWNILLLVQAYLLIIRPEWQRRKRDETGALPSQGEHRKGPATWLVRAVIVFVLAAPLFERAGYWDHWTSWSLYSPHTSRAKIELHQSAIERLDRSIRPFVLRDADGDGWHDLVIEQWSLDSRGVPIYPQGRYQLALAEALARQFQLDDEIRVRLRSVSDRRSGQRDEKRLLGREEVRKELEKFWLTP